MCAVTTDALGLACEQALLFWRAKEAVLERTNERQSREGPPPASSSPLACLSARASTFHDIHKWKEGLHALFFDMRMLFFGPRITYTVHRHRALKQSVHILFV